MTEERKPLEDILSASQSRGLSLIDTAPFLSDDFDPQEYANNIIEAPSGGASKKRTSEIASTLQGEKGANWLPQVERKDLDVEGDVSVALSRLNLAIDDVDRLIRDEVTTHANDLLNHTTTLLSLRPDLAILTSSLRALQEHQEKLIQRVSIPHKVLAAHTARLSKIRSAQSLVKRAERFVRLVRRLQGQLKVIAASEKRTDVRNKLEKLDEIDGEGEDPVEDTLLDIELGEEQGRGLTRAALTVAEISSLVDPRGKESKRIDKILKSSGQDESSEGSLLELDFIRELMPTVEEAREKVTDLMEDMVVRGLRDLSPTLLSTSLQSAYNLGQLADLVRDLLTDLNDVIRDRVAAAFDMQSLSKEVGSREPNLQQATSYSSYRSKRGTTQTDNFSQSTQSQKWNAALWSRLENLIVGEMGAVCSKVYTLERVLSLKTDQMTGTNYLDEAMSVLGDRPSSIFWSTLSEALERQSRQSTKSSNFLSQTLALSYPRLLRLLHDFFEKVTIYAEDISYSAKLQSPEPLKVLRSFDHVEETYLNRARAKLDNFTTSHFSAHRVTGSQEGVNAARLIDEEIDRARFDPILLRHITNLIQSWILSLVRSVSDQRGRDTSALSLQRSSTSTSQLSNAHMTSALYALRKSLRKTVEAAPIESKKEFDLAVQRVDGVYEHEYVGTLMQAILKEVSDTIARMHYVDFSLEQDAIGGSGGSAFMSDLSDRLWYIREQILLHYSVETDKTQWILRIAKHALHSFIVNASLIRPLGEGGKLKLTSDMTELEFALSQLLASAPVPCPTLVDCGSEFKALRTFRALIFKDNLQETLQDYLPAQSGLAEHHMAHHIIVRSKSILLPHELHKWSRIEYLRWLDNHPDPTDAMQLIKGCLDSRKAEETESEVDAIWISCLEDWISRVGNSSTSLQS